MNLQQRFQLLSIVVFILIAPIVHAGSATWLQNPADSNWNNAANWTAGGPPNASSDQATFGMSNQTAISLSAVTEVSSISFGAGANAFAITVGSNRTLTLSGGGILNASGINQNFITDSMGSPVILFKNNATAGTSSSFLNKGGTVNGLVGGATKFYDNSTAGTSSFTNYAGVGGAPAIGGVTQFFGNSNAGASTFVSRGASGPPFSGSLGGATQFFGTSSASFGTFIAGAGESNFANGGSMQFFDNSTASRAVLRIDGGTFDAHLHGGAAEFHNSSTAANSTLVCSASLSEGYAATIDFFDNSTAGNSNITLKMENGDLVSGGILTFHDNSTAGNATIVNKASTTGGFSGSPQTIFEDNATPGNATLITESGGAGHAGAISFNSTGSTVSTARLEIFGFLSSGQTSLTIGSLEGDGSVFLNGGNLSVGSNNLSTTFAGVIQDFAGATGSSLTKIGTGTLTLANTNTYTGLTAVTSGRLAASHDGALGHTDVSLTTPGTTLSAGGGTANNHIFDQAIVSVVTGSTINLNYKGISDVVGSLIVDGVSQPAGIYGGPASEAPHQLPQFTGAGTLLVTTPLAVSRKLHGATNFDANLPFAGTSAVECRNPGANNAYQIVVTFGFPITFNSAAVTSGTANIANVTGNGTPTVTINLTGVTNAQKLAITLSGVNYGIAAGDDVVIRMSVLIGDTNGNGSVNASDITQTKAQSGQPITTSNFREDVNGNGAINASDVTLVKSKSGTALP